MWYEPLRGIKSKGSQAARPGSLGALAAARREHEGQFFTPDDVAALMWRIVEPAMEQKLKRDHSRVSIMDNSVGSGRLLQFANPDKHAIYGVDVDGTTVEMLGEQAAAAGFECEFEQCGMELIDPRCFDVALINPPFSVHLDAPTLEPYPCTCYGRFGPNSAALSHAYALAQAVAGAQLVVALLPRTFANEVHKQPLQFLDADAAARLYARVDLPPRVFREEGTEVQVSLLVFGSVATATVEHLTLQSLDQNVELQNRLMLVGARVPGVCRLLRRDVEEGKPAIKTPVTGDRIVRVVRDGRRVSLRFGCGLTEAKVLNAILRERVPSGRDNLHRHPAGVRYVGQGVFDMEVHLAQDDSFGSFEDFVGEIRLAGGVPQVDPGILGYLKRAARATRRQAMPLRHTVFVEDGVAGNSDQLEARPRRVQVADPQMWGSPAMEPSQTYSFERAEDGRYRFEIAGREFRLTPEDLYERFEVVGGAAESGWTTMHEGLIGAFPSEAANWRARARVLGIDKWLSWGYQFDDLVEMAMKPVGAIAAWDMGLGKARLAAALILLHGVRHGLIVTEAGLIDEMVIELDGLPIGRDQWQVITSPEQAGALRCINVISYERLRLQIGATAERKRMHKTYAGLMRRRLGVAIFDEGDILSNPTSDQARACAQLSARKRYVLSATPMANYPRDLAPTLAFVAGDGTAAQPWGWRRGKLEASWRTSMAVAERGIDAFREAFVTTTWVTREFEDTMTEGAKREIPRIGNLEQYRKMVAPHIKRRIVEEPEVAQWIKIPPEHREVIEVPWDHAHLAYYLKVVEEFSQFYRDIRKDPGKKNNLIAILARIRAVSFASDYPQHGVEGFGAYGALTSKQRWVIDEIERLTHAGRKTVVYAENPGLIELIGRELGKRSIDTMPFHGKIPVRKRTRELNERFRFGPCPNLLATLGVTQKGLNLWQAQEVITLSRSWSATTEEQAIARLLRPQQKANVRVRYVHLPGGIDGYKAQLVHFKRDAARAGLDWGTPETEDADFLHLDTIIGRFVEDMAKLHQLAGRDLRRWLESFDKELAHA